MTSSPPCASAGTGSRRPGGSCSRRCSRPRGRSRPSSSPRARWRADRARPDLGLSQPRAARAAGRGPPRPPRPRAEPLPPGRRGGEGVPRLRALRPGDQRRALRARPAARPDPQAFRLRGAASATSRSSGCAASAPGAPGRSTPRHGADAGARAQPRRLRSLAPAPARAARALTDCPPPSTASRPGAVGSQAAWPRRPRAGRRRSRRRWGAGARGRGPAGPRSSSAAVRSSSSRFWNTPPERTTSSSPRSAAAATQAAAVAAASPLWKRAEARAGEVPRSRSPRSARSRRGRRGRPSAPVDPCSIAGSRRRRSRPARPSPRARPPPGPRSWRAEGPRRAPRPRRRAGRRWSSAARPARRRARGSSCASRGARRGGEGGGQRRLGSPSASASQAQAIRQGSRIAASPPGIRSGRSIPARSKPPRSPTSSSPPQIVPSVP